MLSPLPPICSRAFSSSPPPFLSSYRLTMSPCFPSIFPLPFHFQPSEYTPSSILPTSFYFILTTIKLRDRGEKRREWRIGRKINEFRPVFTKLFALRLLLIHKSKQREEFIRFRSLIPALSPLSLAGPFPLRARQLSTFFSSPLPWNRPDLFLVEYPQ